jgi:hypothetical protein
MGGVAENHVGENVDPLTSMLLSAHLYITAIFLCRFLRAESQTLREYVCQIQYSTFKLYTRP